MRHVQQPKGSKLCGQACVAMLGGVDLELASLACGKHGGTRRADLVAGLEQFRLAAGALVRLARGARPPSEVRGIARIRRPGTTWGGHWVVLDGDGGVYDPSLPSVLELSDYALWIAHRGERLASYFEVLPAFQCGDECPNCGSRKTITGRGGALLDCRECGFVSSPARPATGRAA